MINCAISLYKQLALINILISLEDHPMREFLNPPCRFCRFARITGLSIGVLAVLFLLVLFIAAR